MSWYQTLLSIVLIVTAICSIFFSIRYRMQKEPQARGLNAARMNISMGLMLISFAVAQLTLFEMSTPHLVFGTLLFLLGLFNVFAGFRNRSHFRSMKDSHQ